MILAMMMVALLGVAVYNEPEEATDNVKEELDLRGEWEIACWDNYGRIWDGTIKNRILTRIINNDPVRFTFECSDEEDGKLQFRIDGFTYLGIYKLHHDSVIVCFYETGEGRPRSFSAADGKRFLIMHRHKWSR
jgi:hypothetical protein